LALNERELKQSGRLRSTITAAEFLSAISQMPNASETSGSAESTTCQPLTSSAEDSPARTSATPGSERESTASAADCGPNMRGSFASYDPASSSWRTSQLCLTGEWSEFWETWPRAGTMRNGKAYELRTLAPRTEENESGLWPTPVAQDDNKSPEAHMQMKLRMKGGPRYKPTSLQVMVKGVERRMWPTPRAIYGEHPGMLDPSHLTRAVQFWPTPREFMHKDAAVNRGKSNLGEVVGGQLNPTWVEWLMGYPLGWTALEDSATPSCPKLRNG
jgi:hypothetical protein